MSPEFSFPTVMVGIEILLCSPLAIVGGLGDTPPAADFPCECWMPSGFRKFVLISVESIPRHPAGFARKTIQQGRAYRPMELRSGQKGSRTVLLAVTAPGVLV